MDTDQPPVFSVRKGHKFAQTGSPSNSTPDFSSVVPPPSSSFIIKPQTLSTDKLQGINSIHPPHPTNPFLSISPHFASPSPSFANSFTHNAFSSITASLFDDEETSNACSSSPNSLQVPAHWTFISRPQRMPLGCQRTGVGAVQTRAPEVVDHANERGVGGLLGRPEFEG